MPLFHTFEDAGVHIGMWQLCETVEELTALLPVFYPPNAHLIMGNERRQKEWLATRILLYALLPVDLKPLPLVYDDNGKPELATSELIAATTSITPLPALSISHCAGWVVVAFHPHKPIGIDIEQINNRVLRIKERFLSPEELERIDHNKDNETDNDNNHEDRVNFAAVGRLFWGQAGRLTLAWSIKEAVYKWYGKGEVDFRRDIEVLGFVNLPQDNGKLSVAFKKNGVPTVLTAHYRFLFEHILVWICQ